MEKAITVEEDAVTLNFFERGTASFLVRGVKVALTMETDYPTDGNVRITIRAAEPVSFTLKVRNPGWQDGPKGYALYTKEWSDNVVELSFAMPLKLHYPEHWEEDVVVTDTSKNGSGFHAAFPQTVYHKEEEDHYVAVTRGPLTLAADRRTGKAADSVFEVKPCAVAKGNTFGNGIPCLLNLEFTDSNGNPFTLIDYASAGRDWETEIAAWLPTK